MSKRFFWFWVTIFSILAAASWAYNLDDPMGSYKGVVAYCNGAAGSPRLTHACVEYVRRFYQQVYGITLGPIGGKAQYAFESRYWGGNPDFMAFPQGSSTLPAPDDILCFSGGDYGHVAIVIEVSQEKVKVIEQNFSTKTCYGEMKVENRNDGFYLSSRGNYAVQGWLHYKKANSHQPTTSDTDPAIAFFKEIAIYGYQFQNIGHNWNQITAHTSPEILDPLPSRTSKTKTPMMIKTFVIFRNSDSLVAEGPQKITYYLSIWPTKVPKGKFFPLLSSELNIDLPSGWKTAWSEIPLWFRTEDRGQYHVKIQSHQGKPIATYIFTVE